MSESFTKFSSAAPNPNMPSVTDVTPEELNEKKAKVKIIDVRRPDEWVGEFGHIPEAQLFTLETLPAKITELPKDQTLVFVCKSGGRSAQATALALKSGFKNVYNMRGGMMAWSKSNFETTDRNKA